MKMIEEARKHPKKKLSEHRSALRAEYCFPVFIIMPFRLKA